MATQTPNHTKSNRIRKELQEFELDPPENCSAGPADHSDLDNWLAVIQGPEGSEYEGETFELSIVLPANYPFAPPVVKFITPILHCNIKNGSICLDILKKGWSPALTIGKVLLSITSLLHRQNPDDPLDPVAAELYKRDRDEFRRQVRNYMRKNKRPGSK